MKPSDLAEFVKLQQLSVVPGGETYYVESRMNLDDDRYDTRIVRGEGETVTEGPYDTLPKQSPTDARLAFLRKPDEDGASQLVIRDGSQDEVITDFPLGVGSFNWSPDGARLVVSAGHWIPELADLDDAGTRPESSPYHEYPVPARPRPLGA